jgi:dihydrofolate reductase
MSQDVTIIVATAHGGAIGRRGDLLFHISADLRRFKSLTMGSPIIMGRKTFESFPKGALPGRRNVVITRNAAYAAPGVERVGSMAEALELTAEAEKVFVIGGGEIYAQAMPSATQLEITEIDAEVNDADTFFPTIDSATWELEAADEWVDATDTTPRYRFATYRRRRHHS